MIFLRRSQCNSILFEWHYIYVSKLPLIYLKYEYAFVKLNNIFSFHGIRIIFTRVRARTDNGQPDRETKSINILKLC